MASSSPVTSGAPGRVACGLSRAVWAFVGLGVVLRVVRYLLKFPLWGDESMVAVNLLERGYLDLLRPLEHGQVCPLLFLWIELSAVKLLGFSEWSLRLFPTTCSVASVFVFRHVAGRVLRGVPWLLAVAVFAVAFYPIRHGGEVKPYASDLLASLVLLALAVEWWRAPESPRWLLALAAAGPVALGLSYPAVFVAGGISLGLLGAVWRSQRREVKVAYALYNLAIAGAFSIVYALSLGAQSDAVRLAYRRGYWAGAFPPLGRPLELACWLARAHTGHMFAYPVGGDRGASLLTFACCAAAAVAFWRRRRRTVLAICLAPFGLTLLAATLGRYPYGGSARVMQHLAPIICLMTGRGAARLLGRIRRPAARRRALRACVLALATLGAGLLVRDLVRPYRTVYDLRARDFARRFWAQQSDGAESACILTELAPQVDRRRWAYWRTDLYLCNREIYRPRRPRPGKPRWEAISATRPLRCVLFSEQALSDPAFAAWLEDMMSRFDLRDRRTYTVNAGAVLKSISYEDRYLVFEFVPKADQSRVASQIPESTLR